MSGPSDKAVEAARHAVYVGEVRPVRPHAGLHPDRGHDVGLALEAAHDPALGLDRSVCLRDVVEALRSKPLTAKGQPMLSCDDFIEREFGGGS